MPSTPNKDQAGVFCADKSPIIILNQPQLGENIGMVARAMLNCGLKFLRIVAPNVDIDMERADRASAKATIVMDNMKIYATLGEAVGDINYLYALTARLRDQSKRILGPHIMAQESYERINDAQQVGYLFGKESCGLSNDDVSLANAVVNIPLNPAYSSLNLAQSVLICAYEWMNISYENEAAPLSDYVYKRNFSLANHQQTQNLYEDLYQRLQPNNFFINGDRDNSKYRNIINIFNRADLTTQEVQLLRGMFNFINK